MPGEIITEKEYCCIWSFSKFLKEVARSWNHLLRNIDFYEILSSMLGGYSWLIIFSLRITRDILLSNEWTTANSCKQDESRWH